MSLELHALITHHHHHPLPSIMYSGFLHANKYNDIWDYPLHSSLVNWLNFHHGGLAEVWRVEDSARMREIRANQKEQRALTSRVTF
jgi:hypothetical protein